MKRTTGPSRPTIPTLRTTAAIALVAGLIVLALGLLFSARAGANPVGCQEDDPCWTPLMGNGNGTMYCVVDVRDYQVYLSDCLPITRDLRPRTPVLAR